jgi:transcriptional regulator with XRE-family HTH domain
MSNFSDRIEELKKAKGIMQKDLAKVVNMPLRTYQRYEYGQREPDTSVLIAVADFFNVSIDYLVGRSDDPKRH